MVLSFPGSAMGDEPWADNVGASRLSEGLRWHDLAASGALMINGSDWPVDTLIPSPRCKSRSPGRPSTGSRRTVSIPSTANATRATGRVYAQRRVRGVMENKIGSLESGKLADVIVLSQDLFQVPPNSVGKTKVVLTIVGGKVVWRQGI